MSKLSSRQVVKTLVKAARQIVRAVDVYEKRRHFQVSAQADGRIETEEIQGLACEKSHLKRFTSF